MSIQSPAEKPKKRLLFLSAAYRQHGTKLAVGGVATHVESLAQALAATGRFAIDIVCGGTFDTPTARTLRLSRRSTLEVKKGSIQVYRVPHFDLASFDPRRVLGQEIIEYMLEGWRDERLPDLIHAHDFDAIYYGSILATALMVPLVATMHRAVIAPKNGTPSNAKEAYLRLLAKYGLVDHIIVPSKASRDAIQGRGFLERNVDVVYHGVSARHLASFPNDVNLLRSLGLSEGDRYYLCPVRGDEHTDPSVFIRMAADLVKQEGFAGARFLMTVSETDPLFQDLCSMASRASLRLGIDIVFRTFDRHQMATIYRSARACIVPSPDESFGQTVLEAFVYRCPVIAANSAGLKEVIRHEVNGLHFDVRSSEDLRRHLLRLESSPRLRDQLVANGEQEVMTRFNSMRMASDHRRVYSAVWQSHKRKGPAFR